MPTAADLHRRGLERSNTGHHAEAQAIFEDALAAASDDELRARIELSLAYVEAELGTVEDGLRRCRHALARTSVPPDVQGLIWSQLGMMHMRAGDLRAAMEAFGQAEKLLADDDLARGNLHLNRGVAYLQQKATDRSADDFTKAAEHFERAERPVQVAKARHNLGYAQMLQGEIARGLESMRAARPGLASLGSVAAAVGSQDRAEALMAAGLPDDAVTALRDASAEFAKAGVRQGQGEALLLLARLLIDRDPAEAYDVARHATELFSERGSETWAARAQAVAAAAAIQQGRDDESVAASDEIGRTLRRHGLVHDAVMLDLHVASHELATGRAEWAVRRLDSAPPRDDEPLANRLLRQEVRASVATRSHLPEQALREVRDGLDELAAWQRSFGSLDLQTSVAGHGRSLALTGLGLALDDGRPEVVLEWVDRARALSARVVPVRAPDDPHAAADLAQLRRLRAEIREVETAGDDARELLDEHHDLRRRIRERAWTAPGSGRIRAATCLSAVHRAVGDDDGVLVAHVTDGRRLHALVVDSGHAQVIELGGIGSVRHLLGGMRADLDVAASSVPDSLRAVVRQSLDARLAALDEVLLGPIRRWLTDGRPVVLVPPGVLAGTPWTLLPELRGHPVSVARSVGLWVASRAEPRRAARSAVLVAGPGVARAEEEISRASVWARAVQLTGAEASGDRVVAAASGAQVLHLAAHGLHSADSPLFSGVELADGPWFGYDIDRLDPVPEVVLLSACELGRSTVRWGEEAIGMTSAWLHAGARTVIASPAAVSDDVACEVLAATHTRLAAGVRPAVALRDVVDAVGLQASSSFLCFGQGW